MFNCLIFTHYLNERLALYPRPLAMSQDPWGSDHEKDDKPSTSKPTEGPPDLDEFFAKLLRRDKGGRRGTGLPTPPNILLNAKMVSIASGVLLALWLSTGFYTVKERENGVETFLGKYSDTSKSGLNWHFPYPFGKVELVDVESISTMRIGEFKTQQGTVSTQNQRVGQMLTKDENIVEIGAAVQYRISDAKAFQYNASNPVDVLSDVVASAIREIVGANTVDDILTNRRNEWPQQARQIIVDTLKDYDLGIEIVALELQDARVPAEVQDAFEDAVRAREDEERLRLQAEAFANERLPIARGHAEQLSQAAQAYAVSSIAKANAEATRFNALLVAYQQDKQALRSRLYLDTMSTVYTNNRKLVLEGEAKPIINFGQVEKDMIDPAVLTLETSQPVSVQAASGVNTPSVQPVNAVSNSRDNARSRSR